MLGHPVATVLTAATTTTGPVVAGGDRVIVSIIAVIALLGLAMSFVFRRQVLAAGEGTERMQTIAAAVQEGARAYLKRQFRTLAAFVVIAVVILFFLPGDTHVKVGRCIAFLCGALFSAAIGYWGMSLAVRANVRVAAAAREEGGRALGMRLAIRTGGTTRLTWRL